VDKLVLLGNFAVTAYLCGLIWTIQVVHYPLFHMADRANFAAFEAAHSWRIGLIVMLPMLLEVGLSAIMLTSKLEGVPLWALWLSIVLVIIVWFSTFFLQVPQHGILSGGFDEAAHQFLVNSNWVRTIAWTAKTVLLGWLIWVQINR
jgi:hypothetical protein